MSSVQPMVDGAGRRRSPRPGQGFTPGKRQGTKVGITPLIRRPSMDRRGDAPGSWRALRPSPQRPDHRALARRAGYPRGALVRRDRPGSASRVDSCQAWKERPAARGWHGFLGVVRACPLSAEWAKLPVGPLFCVIASPTRDHAWSASAARLEIAPRRGRGRRAPTLRAPPAAHAHAVELLHEGIPLPLIQRQLGHRYLSTTGTYLQGTSSEEIISTVHARRAHARRAPMMHSSAGLDL
jgi:hypothetical protein